MTNPKKSYSCLSTSDRTTFINHQKFASVDYGTSAQVDTEDSISDASNPKFYKNWQFSPFKMYLKIEDSIIINRKESKTKVTVPSAVSGEDYFKYLTLKQNEKQEAALLQKRERQEIWERKIEEKNKKNLIGNYSGSASIVCEDETGDGNIIYRFRLLPSLFQWWWQLARKMIVAIWRGWRLEAHALVGFIDIASIVELKT